MTDDQIGINSHRSNSTFIMIYEDVWQALKHDATALVVYMSLARRTHQGNNTWYSTRRRMADESGVSVTTFKDKAKVLVGLGVVEVEYRYQDPSTGEMSNKYGGRFTDQKGNLYTVRDHLPHPGQNPTPNIDPLHRSQTQIPNKAAADAATSSKESKTESHQLPQSWQPDNNLWARMTKKHPQLNLHQELQKFRDYWHTRNDKESYKKDWGRSWQNWLNKATKSTPRLTKSHQASQWAEDMIKQLEAEGDVNNAPLPF